MTGDKFPSEKRTYIDSVSNRQVTQLTQNGINFHFYFTENSFDQNNREIYFLSDRAKAENLPHVRSAEGGEGAIFNIFRMQLDSGEMEQITDEPSGIPINCSTKTPDSELIAYMCDGKVKILNTRTMELKVIYEDDRMLINNLSFSCDKKMLGFVRNEDVDAIPDGGPNYAGFKEKLFAVKDGRVSVINVDGSNFRDVFKDTHWLSHFQFSPDDSSTAMFCHEGPWNYVHQRIWILDMNTGVVIPCFRQTEDDCVGHEIWTRDGNIMFDNRRAGHDGTISFSKTQVIATESHTGQVPYFGFAYKDGKVFKKIVMPFYCNHYIANNDNTLFAGDEVENLVVIRPVEGEGKPEITVLASHNTTWLYQRSHCHPTFSWDGKMILYAADTDEEHCNIFLVDAPK